MTCIHAHAQYDHESNVENDLRPLLCYLYAYFGCRRLYFLITLI
uniref:Uncharacterized protein n=1 Tax=Anguilla anguilla TaxID=7936 RepID=A0A0E9V8F4_ANGAN